MTQLVIKQEESDKMDDLYFLLKQFNAIGGMAETGQSGFCLLMALWQKTNELNWKNIFSISDIELLYRAGFNSEKTLINVRNKLSHLWNINIRKTRT